MNLHQHHQCKSSATKKNMPTDTTRMLPDSLPRAVAEQCIAVTADEGRNTRNPHSHHHFSRIKRVQMRAAVLHDVWLCSLFRYRTKGTADAIHAHEHMRSSQKRCANSCNFDARECVTRETPEKNIPCASQASPQENQPARSRPHHQCCYSQAPTFSMTDSPSDISL